MPYMLHRISWRLKSTLATNSFPLRQKACDPCLHGSIKNGHRGVYLSLQLEMELWLIDHPPKLTTFHCGKCKFLPTQHILTSVILENCVALKGTPRILHPPRGHLNNWRLFLCDKQCSTSKSGVPYFYQCTVDGMHYHIHHTELMLPHPDGHKLHNLIN